MEDLIGQTDIVFVIDTTASMMPFIKAARKYIKEISEKAINDGEMSLRLGLVEYRDHPPQDQSFITKEDPLCATHSYQFTNDLKEFQLWLDNLVASGGGDEAEAVFDGIIAGAKMPWREYANRIIWLVGDAPPHGGPNLRPGSSFHWHEFCPCKATLGGCLELLVDKKVTLNSITLAEKSDLKEAFRLLAEETEGVWNHHPNDAEESVTRTISDSYSTATADIVTDRVYASTYSTLSATLDHAPSIKEVATTMKISEDVATASVKRLARRGLYKKNKKGE